MSDEARRILIVDDDRLTLALLADYLEAQGYVVARASSGEEALALYQSLDPHLIVMDICLPGISGIETVQRILATRDVPVIFLSAYEDPEYLRDSIALGGMVCLLKPVTVQQLVPPIESALARAAEFRKLRFSEETLGSALRKSRAISVAIGILMERSHISAEKAFDLLRAEARNKRREAVAVATDVVDGKLDLEP